MCTAVISTTTERHKLEQELVFCKIEVSGKEKKVFWIIRRFLLLLTFLPDCASANIFIEKRFILDSNKCWFVMKGKNLQLRSEKNKKLISGQQVPTLSGPENTMVRF